MTPPARRHAPALRSERAVLVVGHDAEVAVALRERLDRAYVTVHDVDVQRAPAELSAWSPWPWMVVGTSADPGSALLSAVRHRPILLYWLGSAPAGAPRHCRVFSRFADLAGAAGAALSAEVAGIRLSIGSGLVFPAGNVRSNPELEALVCSHPHALALPRSRFRSAQGALRRQGSSWLLLSSPDGVVLHPRAAQR